MTNMKKDLRSSLRSLQLALLQRFCLLGCLVALLQRSSTQHARSLARVIRVVRGTPDTCYQSCQPLCRALITRAWQVLSELSAAVSGDAEVRGGC